MSDNAIPAVTISTQAAPPVAEDLCHAAIIRPDTPTPQQVRAADTLFARPSDADQVAGLVNLAAGVILLRDLALEHFSTADDEERRRHLDLDERRGSIVPEA
jgi:hypothetical protein